VAQMTEPDFRQQQEQQEQQEWEMNEMTKTGLAMLRAPFPPNQISKLCRSTKKDNPKGKCHVCGGWHGLPAIALDYVGHAALTDRLLDADPMWSWEPLSISPEGLPVLDPFGGMWIRLTVCGVTRLGYGHAGEKSGGDAIKEIIGDALRNAAMRFGAALDLWHKGDLHAHDDEEKPEEPQRKANGRLPGVGVHRPTDGAMDSLDDEQQLYIRLLGSTIPKMFTDEGVEAVYDRIEREQFDNIQLVALWSLLDSKVRSALKREKEKRALVAKHPALEAGQPAH
jgi:hypothetical protein